MPRHRRLADLLDAGERERMACFAGEEDQARYLTSHALARIVLAVHAGIPAADLRFTNVCWHCGGPHGKPRLQQEGGSLDFSLAHSGQRVVLAIARSATVGVDVEHARRPIRDVDRLARAVLSEAEQPVIEELPQAERHAALLRYWTRKEALLKATGHGLAVRPSSLTVTGPADAPALVAWTAERPLDDLPVALHDLHPGVDHVGCLAMLGPRLEVMERDATGLLADAVARA